MQVIQMQYSHLRHLYSLRIFFSNINERTKTLRYIRNLANCLLKSHHITCIAWVIDTPVVDSINVQCHAKLMKASWRVLAAGSTVDVDACVRVFYSGFDHDGQMLGNGKIR